MTDKLNRRKFLRGTAVAGAATLATQQSLVVTQQH